MRNLGKNANVYVTSALRACGWAIRDLCSCAGSGKRLLSAQKTSGKRQSQVTGESEEADEEKTNREANEEPTGWQAEHVPPRHKQDFHSWNLVPVLPAEPGRGIGINPKGVSLHAFNSITLSFPGTDFWKSLFFKVFGAIYSGWTVRIHSGPSMTSDEPQRCKHDSNEPKPIVATSGLLLCRIRWPFLEKWPWIMRLFVSWWLKQMWISFPLISTKDAADDMHDHLETAWAMHQSAFAWRNWENVGHLIHASSFLSLLLRTMSLLMF